MNCEDSFQLEVLNKFWFNNIPIEIKLIDFLAISKAFEVFSNY